MLLALGSNPLTGDTQVRAGAKLSEDLQTQQNEETQAEVVLRKEARQPRARGGEWSYTWRPFRRLHLTPPRSAAHLTEAQPSFRVNIN